MIKELVKGLPFPICYYYFHLSNHIKSLEDISPSNNRVNLRNKHLTKIFSIVLYVIKSKFFSNSWKRSPIILNQLNKTVKNYANN